jgi:hypothetical protein
MCGSPLSSLCYHTCSTTYKYITVMTYPESKRSIEQEVDQIE